MIQIGRRPPPSYDDPAAVLAHHHEEERTHAASLTAWCAALAAGQKREAALAGIEAALAFFTGPGARHREDEEFSVFPRIMDDQLRDRLDSLATDHRAEEAIVLALGTILARIHTLPEIPERVLAELEHNAAALRQLLEAHFAEEAELVLPLVKALDPPQQRAIGIEMKLRRG